jgi:hypothetical protein
LFDNGIDVITIADYFALGVRSNCFEEIIIKVAVFESYRSHLISHLLNNCTNHWDLNIRTLAAVALGKISSIYPEDFQSGILLEIVIYSSLDWNV